MKKIITVILSLLLVAGLSACSVSSGGPKAISLDISDRDVDVQYMIDTDMSVFGAHNEDSLDMEGTLHIDFNECEPFESDENLMLVNSSYLHVTKENHEFANQYVSYKFEDSFFDSYFAVPVLSYDIYNPQAIVDVKFTTDARRRSAGDVWSGAADYSSHVGWNLSDADITDAKAGRYFDDAQSSDDVFDTLLNWINTNKDVNKTEYTIPTGEEFAVDSKTTHTTVMDIPQALMSQLQTKNDATNLVITFSPLQKRHLANGINNNKLTITYDLSAASEAEKEFIVSANAKYSTIEDGLTLTDDGARVELVQMKKDVPSESKAIVASYNKGALVKTVTADVTAPGFMKKTVLDLTGFAGTAYDSIKVMSWDGVSSMKPLSEVNEIK